MEPEEEEELALQKREYVYSPIESGAVERFVFARRKPKERGDKPKFYFYTPDLQDLVICASAKKVKSGSSFKISTNSKEIKKKNCFYVGLCSDFQTRKQFVAYKIDPKKPNLFMSAVKIVLTGGSGVVLLAPANAKADFQFPTDPDQQKMDKDLVWEIRTDGESSVRLRRGGKNLLTIVQTDSDEFEVEVAGPMSIFQAFCVTCIVVSAG